jgi:hypothetical protein
MELIRKYLTLHMQATGSECSQLVILLSIGRTRTSTLKELLIESCSFHVIDYPNLSTEHGKYCKRVNALIAQRGKATNLAGDRTPLALLSNTLPSPGVLHEKSHGLGYSDWR